MIFLLLLILADAPSFADAHSFTDAFPDHNPREKPDIEGQWDEALLFNDPLYFDKLKKLPSCHDLLRFFARGERFRRKFETDVHNLFEQDSPNGICSMCYFDTPAELEVTAEIDSNSPSNLKGELLYKFRKDLTHLYVRIVDRLNHPGKPYKTSNDKIGDDTIVNNVKHSLDSGQRYTAVLTRDESSVSKFFSITIRPLRNAKKMCSDNTRSDGLVSMRKARSKYMIRAAKHVAVVLFSFLYATVITLRQSGFDEWNRCRQMKSSTKRFPSIKPYRIDRDSPEPPLVDTPGDSGGPEEQHGLSAKEIKKQKRSAKKAERKRTKALKKLKKAEQLGNYNSIDDMQNTNCDAVVNNYVQVEVDRRVVEI